MLDLHISNIMISFKAVTMYIHLVAFIKLDQGWGCGWCGDVQIVPRPGKVSRRVLVLADGGREATLHLATAQCPAPSADVSRYSVDI